MKKQVKKLTMHHFFGNPYYRGKHILLIAGKAYTSKTGEGISKLIDEVRIKYPKDIPEVAYIPKKQLLTLWM
jgi:hypothetical protein